TGQSGISVASRVSTVVGQFTTCIDALVASGKSVICLTPADYGQFVQLLSGYPNATRRGYVSAAVEAVHSAIVAHAESVNSTAGQTVVSVRPSDERLREVWATNDGTHVTVAGAELVWTSDSSDDGPLFFSIAATTGIPHPGTIVMGLYANTAIDALNDLPGFNIAPFTDAQIRENAGLAAEEPVSVTPAPASVAVTGYAPTA